MVIKDFECCSCGHISEHLVEGIQTMIAGPCSGCGKTTNAISLCNGGCGKRYRFADWGGVDFSGQVTSTAPTATTYDLDGNEIVDKHISGSACQDMPRFSDDVRNERRDKDTFRRAKRAGKNRLFFI